MNHKCVWNAYMCTNSSFPIKIPSSVFGKQKKIVLLIFLIKLFKSSMGIEFRGFYFILFYIIANECSVLLHLFRLFETNVGTKYC